MKPVWLLVIGLLAACANVGAEQGRASRDAGVARPGLENPVFRRPYLPIEGTQQDLVANVGDRVFFDFDSAVLVDSARTTLDRQVAWLNRYPDRMVVIEGHCDERGTREYNIALGERRAEMVRDYLVAHGIAGRRIGVVSYGKEKPVAVGADETAQLQNRRGVTVVTR